MIEPNIKPYLATIAVLLTLIGFIPYVVAILRNKTKPHAFSWVIWSVSTITVFIAQIYSGAGVGAWSLGLSGALTVAIAIMAYCKKSNDTITKIDWIFLFTALFSIPLWLFTDDPLYSVIILTAVDLIGYLPTFKKSYHKPFEESPMVFFIMLVSSTFALAALETYSLTTMLFQTALIIGNALLIATILVRRSLANS
jgi:hypothetical protein